MIQWAVDAHLHLFQAATSVYPRDCFSFYPAEREALVENFLKVMDENNVRHAVIVPLGTELKYLAEILQKYSKKFAGIAVLDEESADVCGDIRRWKEEIGVKGIRIMGCLGDPTASRFEDLARADLLRQMDSLGLIMWFYGSYDQLKLVHLVAQELPNLKIVLNHLGFCQQGFSIDRYNRPHIDVELPPQSLVVVESLAEFLNVYVMFSGEYGFSHQEFPYLDIYPIAQRVFSAYGASRMLWASDWPWIEKNPTYTALISLVDEYFPGITSNERQEIMGATTARLFGFEI